MNVQDPVGSYRILQTLYIGFLGLPRCKNLTRFSLFVSFCFAVRYCLKCFCFLCFTSSVSFTGSYTEVKPDFYQVLVSQCTFC